MLIEISPKDHRDWVFVFDVPERPKYLKGFDAVPDLDKSSEILQQLIDAELYTFGEELHVCRYEYLGRPHGRHRYWGYLRYRQLSVAALCESLDEE